MNVVAELLDAYEKCENHSINDNIYTKKFLCSFCDKVFTLEKLILKGAITRGCFHLCGENAEVLPTHHYLPPEIVKTLIIQHEGEQFMSIPLKHWIVMIKRHYMTLASFKKHLPAILKDDIKLVEDERRRRTVKAKKEKEEEYEEPNKKTLTLWVNDPNQVPFHVRLIGGILQTQTFGVRDDLSNGFQQKIHYRAPYTVLYKLT